MIDIVIVNWNAGIQLKECIDSILTYRKDNVSKIIVVDNGSIDDSINTIEGISEVRIIRTGKNLGFGAACNIGAEVGNAPYILFLNPDTRIEANSLSIPLKFMEKEENSDVGVCGIQLIDEEGNVSLSCAYFPTLIRFVSSVFGIDKIPLFEGSGIHMNDWDHKDSRQVDHVMGAFYLIRRHLFADLGGFDSRYFVYFEDLDLSRAVAFKTFDSCYLTEAKAFHAGGGTSHQVKTHRLFYTLRSRLLYAFKHFSRSQALLLFILVFLIEPFTRSAWCLMRGDIVGIKHTWSAFRMLSKSMSEILNSNRSVGI